MPIPRMKAGLDIAIVGYGTAGQAAAIFLSRNGHRLQVFERAAQLGPVGAGILLQPTGLAVLAELGLLDIALSCGAVIHRLLGHAHTGRCVMDMRYCALHPRYFGLGMQRGALFHLLAQAYADRDKVQTGIQIEQLASDGRTLLDNQGHRYGPFDLIVVADGAASTLRQSIISPYRDQAYPWGALWCLCPDSENRFDGTLLQHYQHAQRMAGILPVGQLPDAAITAKRVSFFWSLPQRSFAAWQDQDISSWKTTVAAYWPATEPLLAHIQSHTQLLQASYRDVVLPRLYQGRMAFLGDAAHAMSPQLGQGANLALLDAHELAHALNTQPNVERALIAYDRNRRKHVNIYQFISRWLTPLFQSEYDGAARMRDALFGPLGRAPFLRKEMLKVLAGTKRGWFGTLPLATPASRFSNQSPALANPVTQGSGDV